MISERIENHGWGQGGCWTVRVLGWWCIKQYVLCKLQSSMAGRQSVHNLWVNAYTNPQHLSPKSMYLCRKVGSYLPTKGGRDEVLELFLGLFLSES